jgi:hypothetical protein
MNWIEHIIEPHHLLLVWQGPEKLSRRRWVVAELTRQAPGGATLRYLVDEPDFAGAIQEGFSGHPAFGIGKVVHDKGVLETFMRRLTPRSRPDFGRYLEALHLHPDARISDFSLLGYSEAKLPGDGFSIVNPFEGVDGPCELLTEASGYRYYRELVGEPEVGESVTIEPEHDNPKDPNALRLMVRGARVGYVNRIQVPAFRRWLDEGRVQAVVERASGTPEHPRLHIFIRVTEPNTKSRAA